MVYVVVYTAADAVMVCTECLLSGQYRVDAVGMYVATYVGQWMQSEHHKYTRKLSRKKTFANFADL